MLGGGGPLPTLFGGSTFIAGAAFGGQEEGKVVEALENDCGGGANFPSGLLEVKAMEVSCCVIDFEDREESLGK